MIQLYSLYWFNILLNNKYSKKKLQHILICFYLLYYTSYSNNFFQIKSIKNISKSLTPNVNKFLFFDININAGVVDNTLFWLSTYLSVFLKHYTILNFYWQFINLSLKKNNNQKFYSLWTKTYTRFFLKTFYTSAWFYFYSLLKLYFFKDIKEFIVYCSKIIQKYSLKFHKKLFILLGSIFSHYLNYLYPYKKLKGYRLYFRGKLGKKGSVKKSTLFFSGGKISYTNKSLKYNYKYFLIPTETGIVGCYISIFF